MIYQLYRAVDRRDNTEALWLLRAPSGAHQMEEMAYLGKAPRPKDIGRHVSQIKRTTFAKPDFYVFESMYGWATHCHHQTRHLIDQWGEQGMTRYAIVVEIYGKDQEHSRYANLAEARYVFYTFGFERSFTNARIVEITE